jgi:transposase-like protein
MLVVTLESTLVLKRGYPNTYREFLKMFPDNAACAAYLVRLRWPEGFTCPACKSTLIAWNESRNRLECPICHHQTYLTAGTIFDKTRTPLTTWFEAAWHLTTAKNGMSAKTLERTLGISYRTAWMILQRFRVAMVNKERKQLSGEVEVDETLVGGVQQGGKRGRGTINSIVVIAVEIKHPKGFGRVRMRYVQDSSGKSLLPFVCDVVAPGSLVHTDGWSGYNELSEHGYTHKVTVLSSSGDPAHVSMPGVHRVASLLKRWILGTHQGSIAHNHLQSYLEEFTFRFNRRTSRSRGLVFRRLLEQSVITKPITENDVKYGYDWDY